MRGSGSTLAAGLGLGLGLRLALVLVLVACIAGACAQAPTEELAIARGRVKEARKADAALFAPELLAEAEAALADSEARLETDRTYRVLIRAAAQASLRADEAFARANAERRIVVVRLRRLRSEIEGLLDMAASRGADDEAPSELATLRRRFDRLESMDNILEAHAEASALKLDALALEQRFRLDERPSNGSSR